MMETMIGIDPHKATHTAVAIDSDEQVLDEFTLRASKAQTERLRVWAGQFDDPTGDEIIGDGFAFDGDLLKIGYAW